jgi:hypothetical protein
MLSLRYYTGWPNLPKAFISLAGSKNKAYEYKTVAGGTNIITMSSLEPCVTDNNYLFFIKAVY